MSRLGSSNPIDRVVYGIVDAPQNLEKAVAVLPGMIRFAVGLPRAIAHKVSWAWFGKHV